MNKNSLKVYYNEILPNLANKQKEVAEAVEKLNTCTIYQAARHLNKFPNQISGRFTELTRKGVIKVVDVIYQDKRPHSVYALNYGS